MGCGVSSEVERHGASDVGRDATRLERPQPSALVRPAEAGNQRHDLVFYPNADRYEGAMRNGLRNGGGTYRWAAAGNEYTGQWFNDDMHGVGTHRYSDGRSYTGLFLFGTMHGHGTYIFADRSRFAGAFANNLIYGTGVYTTATGVQYEVDWRGVEPMLAPVLVDVMRGPQPLAAADGRWPCPACTFDNQANATQCAMCDTARPPPSEPVVRLIVRQESIRSIAEAPAFVRQHTVEEAAEAYGLTRAESLEFTSACVICIAAPRRVALVPCGHFCLCEDCLPLQARADKRCPMCRSNFTAGLRVIVPPVPAGKAAETSCSGCGEKPRTHAAMPCGHLVLCGDCADGGARARACPVCHKNAKRWHRIFMIADDAGATNSTSPP